MADRAPETPDPTVWKLDDDMTDEEALALSYKVAQHIIDSRPQSRP
jgi:hypothetical protein